MTDHVLISPLGRSPGAVSGVALALIGGHNTIGENFNISRVITVGTSHPKVKAAARILKSVFNYTEILYEEQGIEAAELREGDGSANAYMQRFGQVLEEVNADQATVHVAVTAGRAGMGALAALSTNLYGTDYMWHFWVHDDIASRGDVDLLEPPLTIDNVHLNPTLEEGSYELVDLPAPDLRPLHPVIWEYLREDKVPDVTSPLYPLFASGKIRRLQDIFPATLTMSQADRILELRQQYPGADEATRQDIMAEFWRIIGRSTIIDDEAYQRLQKLVTSGASAEKVLAIARRAEDKTGFWHWVENNQDKIAMAAATATASDFLLNAIQLWLQFQGYIN